MFGLDNDDLDYRVITKYYHEINNQGLKIFDFVKDILIRFDTGIKDIEIHKGNDHEKDEPYFFPIFNYDLEDKNKVLPYHSQSSGVKALYKQLVKYKLALDTGGLLALDEFDTNLHPDILPELVELFINPKTNPHNAQFIFSTHNNEIMDTLKKYRVVLVNREDNESYLYRLDELSDTIIRNDRPITPLYKNNKIGGKPKIKHG
jgi:AAA15 family ATPase/GTPase